MRKRKEKSKVVYSIEVGSCHENISSCLKSENLSGLLHMRLDCALVLALVLALALALSRGTGGGAIVVGDCGPRGVAMGARGSRLEGGRLGGENRSNGVHSVQVVVKNSSLMRILQNSLSALTCSANDPIAAAAAATRNSDCG